MKARVLMICCLILIGVGCQSTTPVAVSVPPPDPCPLPSGYKLAPAVEIAEQTLNLCPSKLDEVFARLIEISKDSPDKENALLIQDLLKRMVTRNKISETYSRDLYKRYFSPRFVSVPDVKTYNLAGEIETIKKGLREELALKRIGMLECSNDRASYTMAEAEYARIVGFMENLVMNEQYMKESR